MVLSEHITLGEGAGDRAQCRCLKHSGSLKGFSLVDSPGCLPPQADRVSVCRPCVRVVSPMATLLVESESCALSPCGLFWEWPRLPSFISEVIADESLGLFWKWFLL